MIIKYLDYSEYTDLKRMLHTLWPEFDEEEPYGFTITIKREKIVIVYEDPNLTYDEIKINCCHEVAHAKGIKDDEDADKWAVRLLSPKQKELLISRWEQRHGHPYKK